MTCLNHDIFANLDRLRLPAMLPTAPAELKPAVPPPPPKAKLKKITGEFLKGPIPLPWLTAASSGTTELMTRSTGRRPAATRPTIRGKS